MKNASIIALVVLILIIIAIAFSSWQLYAIRSELSEKQTALEAAQAKLTETEKKAAEAEAKSKRQAEAGASLSALQILAEEGMVQVSSGVDVNALVKQVNEMGSSERKTALIAAMVVAVKRPGFRLGGETLRYGMDSPAFANYVLNFTGKTVSHEPGGFLSESMMQQFSQIDQPEPGDLMFFDGTPGNFVLFYLGPGNGGPGVGVGHLNRKMRSGIYDTEVFTEKFKGYYRF